MAVSLRTRPDAIETSDDRSRLEQRAAVLYLRLEDGYAQIERALGDGQDVTRWEELWHHLLREYEHVSDLLLHTEH